MARSSVALFLVATGLITATMGCTQAPEPREIEGGEAGVSTPSTTQPSAGAPTETPDGGDMDEGGEGGEGGEAGGG